MNCDNNNNLRVYNIFSLLKENLNPLEKFYIRRLKKNSRIIPGIQSLEIESLSFVPFTIFELKGNDEPFYHEQLLPDCSLTN